ncbi:competence/damage-inducible protein A [Pelosinus sp. sgz500959]|uniref:competence/damage-inducible protein A n=1 Tax=Pelosinus sp. sgz500959 TaxID=3242472 RepID=UPI00366FF90A
MIVEIVTTGTELLLGQIIDTNTPFLSQRLNELGFDVLYHSTVGDNKVRMTEVLTHALHRSDLIITSGGLGPTQGDITKEVTATLLNRPLLLDDDSVENIKMFFANRQIPMPDSNLRQGMIPEGAIVIKNERGTAPGVIIEHDSKTIIHLPGPPHELEWMFEHAIIPYLKQRFPIQGIIVSKILHTYGIGESALEEKIKDFIISQSNPTIALLAKQGEVIIRLTAKSNTVIEAEQLIAKLEEQLRQRIADYIWGLDNDTIEANIGKILAEKQLTIALAESCTGGLITSRITDISGSSNYLMGSIVCYTNEIKSNFVDVPPQIITDYGAVSHQTASLLATGIRQKFTATLGMGITGIAGPTGATPTKTVGTVYIAIDGPNGIQCKKYTFNGQRIDIKYRISQAALHMLRQYTLSL